MSSIYGSNWVFGIIMEIWMDYIEKLELEYFLRLSFLKLEGSSLALFRNAVDVLNNNST